MSPYQARDVYELQTQLQPSYMQTSLSMPVAANGQNYLGANGHQVLYLPQSASAYPVAYPQVYPQPLIVYDPTAYGFETIAVRMDYVRKVLGVIFAQIGLCFLIVNIFNLRSLKEWGAANSWFLPTCFFAAAAILVLLACFAEQRSSTCPVNIILVGLFTFTASLAMGMTSSFAGSDLIYLFDVALIISFALVFSLILYAFQSNFDFNMINCIKYVVLIVTVFVGIYLLLIIVWSVWLALFLPTVAYSVAGALMFTSYLIADLTLMMRRSHINGLTPESLIFGVICLHTDIINPNGNFWGKC